MLDRLTVRGFKSLRDVSVELPRLAVLFGPNAAGKSNLLDAIEALSWLGVARTLSDVLDPPAPVRGHAFEAFAFLAGGLPELLRRPDAQFFIEADLTVGTERYRYRVEPRIELGSGRLSVADEYLAQLGAAGRPKGKAAIGRVDAMPARAAQGQARPPAAGAAPSDRSLGGDEYRWLEVVRNELGNWSTHYLDPHSAMRAARAPADVVDVGVPGQQIAPFLYGPTTSAASGRPRLSNRSTRRERCSRIPRSRRPWRAAPKMVCSNACCCED